MPTEHTPFGLAKVDGGLYLRVFDPDFNGCYHSDCCFYDTCDMGELGEDGEVWNPEVECYFNPRGGEDPGIDVFYKTLKRRRDGIE